jgi:hypothetical protein
VFAVVDSKFILDGAKFSPNLSQKNREYIQHIEITKIDLNKRANNL